MNDAESTPQSNEASLAERGDGAPSVGSKKTTTGRKKQNRFGSESSRQQRSLAGGALTREERKNEQIIRMIERQENLNKRRERRKQGLPVSTWVVSDWSVDAT